MIVIGIDIGLTGAACAIERNGARVEDLPTKPDGANGSHRLDGRGVILLLRQLMPADRVAVAALEDVRPRPNPSRGTSIVTEGGLMRSRGIIEAACDIAGIRMLWVQPQSWKRFYGLLGKHDDKAKAKAAARALACELYPAAADRLARVKDQNRAEAILIGHYARAKELGQ